MLLASSLSLAVYALAHISNLVKPHIPDQFFITALDQNIVNSAVNAAQNKTQELYKVLF